MNSSGFAWVAAWTFLYTKTGRPEHLGWAQEMVDYFASLRDPETDLLAAHPYDPQYPATLKSDRDRARASRTEYMGQITFLTANLLSAAEMAGGEVGQHFRDEAVTYYRAFMTRMDAEPDGSFFATFDLKTGEPLFPRITDGWAYIPQQSEKYDWGNRVLGVRAPATMAFGYLKTRDPAMRELFDKLLPLFRLEEFASGAASRKDLPAALIGQAIVAFLNMHEATGEEVYLNHAGVFSAYAMKHYVTDDGWIVCGPSNLGRYQDENLNTWRIYSNRGGSDDLALALVKYHLVRSGEEDFVEMEPLCFF
ncbi:MAG: hypothetical protein HQ582_01170, partial [Planctomycetes bacterium]|nr:hypothetical protein [Planctomycetota bacterium]